MWYHFLVPMWNKNPFFSFLKLKNIVEFNHKEESCFDFLYQLFLGKMHCDNPLRISETETLLIFPDCQWGGGGCVKGLRSGYRRAPTSESGEGLFHKGQGNCGYIRYLSVGCHTPLRSTIPLKPVAFKSANNRRGKEHQSRTFYNKSPVDSYLSSKTLQWFQSRSADATQWKNPCKITGRVWRKRWNVTIPGLALQP